MNIIKDNDLKIKTPIMPAKLALTKEECLIFDEVLQDIINILPNDKIFEFMTFVKKVVPYYDNDNEEEFSHMTVERSLGIINKARKKNVIIINRKQLEEDKNPDIKEDKANIKTNLFDSLLNSFTYKNYYKVDDIDINGLEYISGTSMYGHACNNILGEIICESTLLSDKTKEIDFLDYKNIFDETEYITFFKALLFVMNSDFSFLETKENSINLKNSKNNLLLDYYLYGNKDLLENYNLLFNQLPYDGSKLLSYNELMDVFESFANGKDKMPTINRERLMYTINLLFKNNLEFLKSACTQKLQSLTDSNDIARAKNVLFDQVKNYVDVFQSKFGKILDVDYKVTLQNNI